jgi:O-antigen/teichoic acid export membrane protein
MRDLLGVRVTLTIAGVAVALAFTVVAGYGSTIVAGTALVGAGLVLQSVQTLVAVPLAGALRFGWATATDLVRQVVIVALTIALILAGAKLLAFTVLPIIGGAVALALTTILVRGSIPFRPSFNRHDWWLLLRDSLPYAAAIALNVAYFRIAVIIVSLASSKLETGYFSISYRILEVLLPIPALVVGAAFPIIARAARDDPRRLAYVTGRIFETAVIAGGWMVVALELGAPFMVQVLAGSDAGNAVPVLRLQGLALVATFVAVACAFPLLSLRRHRELLLANAVALAFSIALATGLVHPLGARGAAIGTATAEYALAIVTAILLARARRDLRPPVQTVAYVLLAAGPAMAAWLLPVHPVVRVVVATGVYVGILAALGQIPTELVHAVRRPREST